MASWAHAGGEQLWAPRLHMHIPHQGARHVCCWARRRLSRGRGFICWKRYVWELLSAAEGILLWEVSAISHEKIFKSREHQCAEALMRSEPNKTWHSAL